MIPNLRRLVERAKCAVLSLLCLVGWGQIELSRALSQESSGTMQMGSGEGRTLDPRDTTVSGAIIDLWGRPVANASVSIGEKTVVSDGAGRFTIASVAPVYDVEIENRIVSFWGAGSDTVGNGAWVFEGLTRRDPTLQVQRAWPRHNQSFVREVKGVSFPLSGQFLQGAVGGPDTEFEFTQRSETDNGVAFWEGPDRTSAIVHALLWEHQPDGPMPLRYLAYATAPITFGDEPGAATVQLDMSPKQSIASRTISGTISAPAGITKAEMHVFVRFPGGAVIPLLADAMASEFSYLVPVLPGATIGIIGETGSSGSPETAVLLENITPGQSGLEVRFRTPPTLISPAHLTGTAAPDQELRWQRQSPVSVVVIGTAYGEQLYIVTAAQHTRLRTLRSGFGMPADEALSWHVEHHGDFESVDAAAGPDGLWGIQRTSNFNYLPVASRTSSRRRAGEPIFYTKSSTWQLDDPP